MPKTLQRILTVAAALSLIIVTACVSNECLDNKNSLPLAGFYASGESEQKVTLDSISIFGIDAPEKSMILDSATNISSVYLPFRIDQPSTTYVIRYEQKAISDSRYNDTLQFDYDIIPYFVSSACGAIYKYKINRIVQTHHLIDSVVCTSPDQIIDNTAIENIRIYFRVNSQSEE